MKGNLEWKNIGMQTENINGMYKQEKIYKLMQFSPTEYKRWQRESQILKIQ